MTAHLTTPTPLSSPLPGASGGTVRRDPFPPPLRPPDPVLVVVAHGSRDPRALSTVQALLDRVRALRPGLPVHLGHIELNEPLLTDTLAGLYARGTGSAVLVPLLFGRGHHVEQDIPEMAAASPLPTRIAAPLGSHPLLVDALYARLTEAGWRRPADEATRRASAVVLAAAGSRVPESWADTARTADRLARRLGVPVVPAYASTTAPTISEALRALAAQGRHRVAVASCFTAPGRFATQCAEASPGITAAPLGTHPTLARLLLHRYTLACTPPTPTRHLTSA